MVSRPQRMAQHDGPRVQVRPQRLPQRPALAHQEQGLGVTQVHRVSSPHRHRGLLRRGRVAWKPGECPSRRRAPPAATSHAAPAPRDFRRIARPVDRHRVRRDGHRRHPLGDGHIPITHPSDFLPTARSRRSGLATPPWTAPARTTPPTTARSINSTSRCSPRCDSSGSAPTSWRPTSRAPRSISSPHGHVPRRRRRP